MVDRSRV